MKKAYSDDWTQMYVGDALTCAKALPEKSVHCLVTSPPYHGLRSYLPAGHPDKVLELGAEPTVAEYVEKLVAIFRALRPALRDDSTLWVNVGDRFLPNKQLAGAPWRFAFAMQDDGWILRMDNIWSKPNPMPESVSDRPTKSHEYLLLLTKKPTYFYDQEAVREPHTMKPQRRFARDTYGSNGVPGKQMVNQAKPLSDEPRQFGHRSGRNLRSVWNITTKPYRGSHYAVMPPDLVYPCVKAGTSEYGVCSSCLAPWERVVEREAVPKRVPTGKGWLSGIAEQDNWASGTPTHSGLGNTEYAAPRTVDWQPTCECHSSEELARLNGTATIPATVLDPFAGSGTTLYAARKLGRKSVGFDLDARNVKLVEGRLGTQGVLL